MRDGAAMKRTASLSRTSDRTPHLSELSAARQALIRLCQWIDYGQILELHVREREPEFSPEPVMLLEVKLDSDPCERQETELEDFTLRGEVQRLLSRLDVIGTGCIQKIEVRAGIPRR